jgi:bifunctional non-homologous end joining protein LigD
LPRDIHPADLIRLREPFDSAAYVFELKMDGFRALAHVAPDGTRLVSRRGNVYRSFPRLCDAIRNTIDCEVVLDGEIVCLDPEGRSQFYDLLRRRGDTVFYAFDVLWMDGADLRDRPLIERKRLLRSVVPAESPSVLYADHIEGRGVEFFRRVCE